MFTMDRNPYSPPNAPVADIVGSGPQSAPLYSPRQMYLAAFLGTPIAAAWFMRRNFKTLGNESRAENMLWLGVVATVAVFSIGTLLPSGIPNMVVPIAYSYAIYQYASFLFKAEYDKHINAGGRKGSTWTVVGVSLLIAIIFIAVVIAVVFAVRTYPTG